MVALSVTPVPVPESLSVHVLNEVRRLIIVGELPAGSRLIESKLSDTFQVSRGPVRDALSALEAENLVESRRNKAYVVGLSDRDIDEIYGLRALVEGEALVLAAAEGRQGDWSLPIAALSRMRAAAALGDPVAVGRADLDFHSSFYRIAGQRRLESVWNQYKPTFGVLLELSNLEGGKNLEATVRDHEELLETVASGDINAVRARFSTHNVESLRRMQAFHARIEQKDPELLRLISKEKLA